jgi:guanylate kinase
LPRQDEVQGQSYYFVTSQEFKNKIQHGAFFEWEETHGNYYGTTNDALNAVVESGFSPLLIIDVRGALSFKTKYPNNSVLIFLSPSNSDVLDERLISRGDDKNERQVRLASAQREYTCLVEASDQFDYLVINDNIQTAVDNIKNIVKSEKMRAKRIDRTFLENLGPKEK